MRIGSGEEVLVARVVAGDGKVGFGFSFHLDATQTRHMAEWHAGLRKKAPQYLPALDHPWERAWLSGKDIPWTEEPAFARIQWLPTA
jgi:hypothetical protein